MVIRNQNHRKLPFQPQIPPVCYPKNRNQVSRFRRFVSILAIILIYQIFPFAAVGYSIYAAITLDYKVIGVLGLLTIIQIPLRRSKIYCDLVTKILIPTLNNRRFERYFQQQIDQKKDTRCLFAMHPHSVITYGMIVNMNLDDHPLSKMTLLGSRFIMNYPILGAILKLWGIESVNAENLNRLMKKQVPIGLAPGGFQQATLTTPKEFRVYVKNRKGFIKYALKNGYTIYPTLILNQHKAFWTFDYLTELRLLVNKIKMPAVIFLSQLGILYPINTDVFTVVGKGIRGQCKNSDQPTQQQIDQVHQRYVQEIKRVYQKYKALNDNTPIVLY